MIHTCHAIHMPRPCRSERDFSGPRESTYRGRGMGTAWHVWINISRRETACGLPARVRLLPATTRSSTQFVAYQSQMQWPVWNQTFVMDEENLIILVEGHEWLYNSQHKHYDNNLVKCNCWKEISGDVHPHGKEQATQYFVRYRKAYFFCKKVKPTSSQRSIPTTVQIGSSTLQKQTVC